MVTVRELGRKRHVELIIRDVAETTAWRRWLLKPGEQHTPPGISFQNLIKADINYTQTRIDFTSDKNNLCSVLPMSRQPSRMYRGFRMAAVPDADRIHTSSLCWEEIQVRRWKHDLKPFVLKTNNKLFAETQVKRRVSGAAYSFMNLFTTTYQMLVLSLYPTTAWQPRALAWDLISCRISSHQASRVSGSSAKHKSLNQKSFTK